MNGRFVRLAETNRLTVSIVVDGNEVQALEGDTLMTAILHTSGQLRTSEFGGGNRAGFCLMSACQDCWVWTENNERLRACSTIVLEGLKISTREPETTWVNIV